MLLLLLSCTNAERYTDDLAIARCDTYERCDVLGVLGFDDLADCVDLRAGLEVPTCSLDRTASRECVGGWEEITCESMATEQPQACFEVCLAEDTDAEQ